MLPLIERGRKAAGVALLSIGIVSGVWFLLCQFSTPFIAWASAAARERLMQIMLDNVKAFLDGKPINSVIK